MFDMGLFGGMKQKQARRAVRPVQANQRTRARLVLNLRTPHFGIILLPPFFEFDDVRTTSLLQLLHEIALNNAFSLWHCTSKDYTPNYYTQKC